RRISLLFPSALRPPPCSTPFPYTTLFRSVRHGGGHAALIPDQGVHIHAEDHPLRILGPEKDAHYLVELAVIPVRDGEPHSGSFKDRKSTRLNSSHVSISYAVFCLKKKIHH